MSELKLRLFGEPQLEYQGKRLNLDRRKAFALLAYLALAKHRQKRDFLATFLLGVFVPKPATFDLGAMATAWEVSDPKPFARILVNRGLLEPISGGRFQMHALLVYHARSLLEEIMPG